MSDAIFYIPTDLSPGLQIRWQFFDYCVTVTVRLQFPGVYMFHRRFSMLVAVVALIGVGFGLAPARPVTAQDGRAAAEQYAASVILAQRDITAYRLVNSSAVDAGNSGALAIRWVRFEVEQRRAPYVYAFEIWVHVFAAVEPASALVADIRNNRSYTEPGGASVSVTWDGPLTGVD